MSMKTRLACDRWVGNADFEVNLTENRGPRPIK